LMNVSKRCATCGRPGQALASGEISIGRSTTCVGWINLCSTFAPNAASTTCPQLTPGSVATPTAFAASRAVARIYRTGGFRILVTCAQGRNRSGLVVALALLELGASPKDAIGAVRQARGPHALSNAWFVKLIHEAAGRRFLRFPMEASP